MKKPNILLGSKVMFYSMRYAKACSKLGLNRKSLDKYEIQNMMSHADMCKKLGRKPEDGAVSIYEIIMPDKIRETPNIFKPIAIMANQQITQWLCAGKISHERGQEVTSKIFEAFSSDDE
jgi:hypothetical protein